MTKDNQRAAHRDVRPCHQPNSAVGNPGTARKRRPPEAAEERAFTHRLRNVVSDVGSRAFGPKSRCGYPSDAKLKRDVPRNPEQRVETIHHRRMQRRRHRADADRARSRVGLARQERTGLRRGPRAGRSFACPGGPTCSARDREAGSRSGSRVDHGEADRMGRADDRHANSARPPRLEARASLQAAIEPGSPADGAGEEEEHRQRHQIAVHERRMRHARATRKGTRTAPTAHSQQAHVPASLAPI
jgi:hypothetical protein